MKHNTLESILSKKVEVDKQKDNAMRMICYGTNVHKQQQAEHQAALSALTKEIHMFDEHSSNFRVGAANSNTGKPANTSNAQWKVYR